MFNNNQFKVSKAKIANVWEDIDPKYYFAYAKEKKKKLVIVFKDVEVLNNATIVCSVDVEDFDCKAKNELKLALGLNLSDELNDVDVTLAMDNEKVISVEGIGLKTVDLNVPFVTQKDIFKYLDYFVQGTIFDEKIISQSIEYIQKLHAFIEYHEDDLLIANNLNYMEFMNDLANIKDKYEKAFN